MTSLFEDADTEAVEAAKESAKYLLNAYRNLM